MDSDENEPAAIADPKTRKDEFIFEVSRYVCLRFLVRNTGFAAIKVSDSALNHDKGHLLPSSTKASSDEDSGDSNNLSSISGPNIGSRHLPPIYIDI